MPAPLVPDLVAVKRPTCASCGGEFQSHFRVAWYNRKGKMIDRAIVCSIGCLIRWVYVFGIRRGLAVAAHARGMFAKLITKLTTPGAPR